jgi:hypothetical protein
MGRGREETQAGPQDLDPGPVPEAEEPEVSFGQLWEAFEPGQRVSKGIYSIYKTAEGGMHISYRPEGAEEDQHLPIPAPMVAMMTAAAEGKGPLGRLRAIASARFGG